MKTGELARILCAGLLSCSLQAVAGQALTLTVLVDGARPNTGQAVGSLFSSEENYLNEPLYKIASPVDNEGKASIEFHNLQAGTYAVSIVYDENSDGKLNTGFLGIPTELIGFSNNVTGTFGPPSFAKTAFSLSSSDSISITLNPAKK